MYSYCESVHATSNSPWHIRKLTEVGRRLSGGVDTPSLCGRVRKGWGWDLEVVLDGRLDKLGCPKCVELYKQERADDEL